MSTKESPVQLILGGLFWVVVLAAIGWGSYDLATHGGDNVFGVLGGVWAWYQSLFSSSPDPVLKYIINVFLIAVGLLVGIWVACYIVAIAVGALFYWLVCKICLAWWLLAHVSRWGTILAIAIIVIPGLFVVPIGIGIIGLCWKGIKRGVVEPLVYFTYRARRGEEAKTPKRPGRLAKLGLDVLLAGLLIGGWIGLWYLAQLTRYAEYYNMVVSGGVVGGLGLLAFMNWVRDALHVRWFSPGRGLGRAPKRDVVKSSKEHQEGSTVATDRPVKRQESLEVRTATSLLRQRVGELNKLAGIDLPFPADAGGWPGWRANMAHRVQQRMRNKTMIEDLEQMRLVNASYAEVLQAMETLAKITDLKDTEGVRGLSRELKEAQVAAELAEVKVREAKAKRDLERLKRPLAPVKAPEADEERIARELEGLVKTEAGLDALGTTLKQKFPGKEDLIDRRLEHERERLREGGK